MTKANLAKLNEIASLLNKALELAREAEADTRAKKQWADQSAFAHVCSELGELMESDGGEAGLLPLLKFLNGKG